MLKKNCICPLCRSPAFFFCTVAQNPIRSYYRCEVCRLVFLDRTWLPTPTEEKKIYDLHQNSPSDPHYRRFLNRIYQPMQQCIESGSYGLDFGSGPGPTLSVMFEESGHRMEIYDPFYAPHLERLNQQYDFITTSETVEHLHYPERELNRLWSILKPGGWLGIMTKRFDDSQAIDLSAKIKAFSRWHYIQCPTHVIFFSIDTFRWLSQHWRVSEMLIADNDVVLLRKPKV